MSSITHYPWKAFSAGGTLMAASHARTAVNHPTPHQRHRWLSDPPPPTTSTACQSDEPFALEIRPGSGGRSEGDNGKPALCWRWLVHFGIACGKSIHFRFLMHASDIRRLIALPLAVYTPYYIGWAWSGTRRFFNLKRQSWTVKPI